jgi:hypothetical protein
MLLHGAPRFAHSRAEFAGHPAEGFQYIFFFGGCRLPVVKDVPVRQFFARRLNMYWLPRLTIDPSSIAAAPTRSQTSFATSAVSVVSAGRLIRPSVA